jgi:phosphoribosyl 1,2-cyclic phosphodiesterase
MLQSGPYPLSLKKRVSSDYGHLSNLQSISLLRAITSETMKTLIIGHISEKNNHPNIIEELLLKEKNLPKPLLATQSEGFAWVSL